MENQEFRLGAYLPNGVEKIVKGAINATLTAPRESACNLHCAGCYSRQNHACTEAEPVDRLTSEDWKNIFAEAKELGINFILLAGGEPLLRKDVIETAGEYPDILFPVFTNGTLLGDESIDLFDKKRNLLPVLSIEGRQEKTDERHKTVEALLTESDGE